MKEQRWIKRILFVGILIFSILGYKGITIYKKAFRKNIYLKDDSKETTLLYIPTGTSYDSLLQLLDRELDIKNYESLKWTAEKKNLKSHVYPGKYTIRNGSSNNDLINMLRSGKQTIVQLTFNNIRTLPELSKRIAEQIETNETELFMLLTNDSLQKAYGFNRNTIISMFIPNTYEVYWNTNASEIVERMHTEYNRFWTAKRAQQAKDISLSETEVITLASIVDEETLKKSEMPIIAGVYINRLKKGMRLQADPTVKFAIGDFTIRRVLNKHLRLDSPYNTYRYGGLPPGPIRIPSIAAIDAVLNFEKHNYYYFCAKEDFSGYHRFAKTNSEHNRNRALYQKALNKRKIYR